MAPFKWGLDVKRIPIADGDVEYFLARRVRAALPWAKKTRWAKSAQDRQSAVSPSFFSNWSLD